MLLASETLKMVIAVICLGFLVYLLAAVYFSNADSKNLVQAESSVERIGEVINRLEVVQNVSSENVSGLTPAGWTMFSFTLEEKKPNSCARNNCLCVCDDVFDSILGFDKDRQLRECDEKGKCLIISNLIEFTEFEFAGAGDPSDILVEQKDGGIEVSQI